MKPLQEFRERILIEFLDKAEEGILDFKENLLADQIFQVPT